MTGYTVSYYMRLDATGFLGRVRFLKDKHVWLTFEAPTLVDLDAKISTFIREEEEKAAGRKTKQKANEP